MVFKIYTEVYDLLVEFLEWFNEKWTAYHLFIEPFLQGSEEIIGVFTRNNKVVFFYIDEKLPGRYRIEESTNNSVFRYTVNPHNFITRKELEFLFLEILVKK